METKVFVSLPMSGRDEKEVRKRMLDIYEKYKKVHQDKETIFVDQFIKAIPLSIRDTKKEGPWCLGDSVKLMAMADIVIFANDFLEARGCRIEHDICVAYDLMYINEIDLDNQIRKNEIEGEKQ